MCYVATGLNLCFQEQEGKLGNKVTLRKFFVDHNVVLTSFVSNVYKFSVTPELHEDEHFVDGR